MPTYLPRTSYAHNAWGEHTVTNYTSANIGNINPFRYRGYYYDTETGFYYLNARHYDPQVKRFISPDTFDNLGANGDLNSFNLYAYCSNCFEILGIKIEIGIEIGAIGAGIKAGSGVLWKVLICLEPR